jgi:hypothetical protein
MEVFFYILGIFFEKLAKKVKKKRHFLQKKLKKVLIFFNLCIIIRAWRKVGTCVYISPNCVELHPKLIKKEAVPRWRS